MATTTVFDVTLINGEIVTVNVIDGILGRVGQDGHAWFAIGREDSEFDILPEDYDKPYFVAGKEVDGKMKYNAFLIKTKYVASINTRIMQQVEYNERS